jgi:hypothetical protein
VNVYVMLLVLACWFGVSVALALVVSVLSLLAKSRASEPLS